MKAINSRLTNVLIMTAGVRGNFFVIDNAKTDEKKRRKHVVAVICIVGQGKSGKLSARSIGLSLRPLRKRSTALTVRKTATFDSDSTRDRWRCQGESARRREVRSEK